MSNKRHYTDEGLRQHLAELNKGQQTMLVTGGALPAEFKRMDVGLTSSDVARLIELAESEGDAPKVNTA